MCNFLVFNQVPCYFYPYKQDMSWRVVGYYQGAAPAKPEGVVRVICLADTHDRDLPSFPVPDGDVLVHAGGMFFCHNTLSGC